MSDPFTLLELDHRVVERLLSQLGESEEGAERETALAELQQSLAVHLRFEEEAVYPLIKQAIDESTAVEAEVEHGLAREGLTKLADMVTAPGFGAAVEMLKGGITHHVEEEESEIFPALRKSLARGVQDKLVTKLMDAKAAAGLPKIALDSATKEQLLELARIEGIDGRTQMTKDELRKAVMSRG